MPQYFDTLSLISYIYPIHQKAKIMLRKSLYSTAFIQIIIVIIIMIITMIVIIYFLFTVDRCS